MMLIRLILWIFTGILLTYVLLPLIGAGLLFFLLLFGVLFVVSFASKLLTGQGGISFHTFKMKASPREKAEAAKAEQEEIFDAEFGEESGEVVELPASALHKEE